MHDVSTEEKLDTGPKRRRLDASLPRTPSPVQQPATPPRSVSQIGIHITLSPAQVVEREVVNLVSSSQYTPKPSQESTEAPPWGSESMYIQAFELVLNIVTDHEGHLFSAEELKIFETFRNLSYESRYLFVRLFLRKRGVWFRMNKLPYESDIGNMQKACDSIISIGLGDSDKTIKMVDEALGLLNLDELKMFAKVKKCAGKNKAELAASLRQSAQKQASLQPKGTMALNFDAKGKLSTQDSAIIREILQLTGPCIRLVDKHVELFHRVHVVYFRSTEYNEKSLTTMILARIAKRNFPHYVVQRTVNVFGSRDSLLEYIEAIKYRKLVDDILENSGYPKKQDLERVLDIFSSFYPKWRALIGKEIEIASSLESQSIENQRAAYYLRRFTPGWVYTRLVFKGAYVLSRFQKAAEEHEVLERLLSQKLYRRGRRGEWYDRKALIEQHYMFKYESNTSVVKAKRKWRLRALDTCSRALQDIDTHVIFHHPLQNRIKRLEKALGVPRAEQHDFRHSTLKAPDKKEMTGVRCDVDRETGKKSTWMGNDGNIVSVEQLCLEQYEREGWKGFHSENGVVTTIFGLLFWDILFLPVPGVFETHFQTAPLDLVSDAFCAARMSEINHRLAEIANGQASEILQKHNDTERPKLTWCVGVNWSYKLDNLLEIIEVRRSI